MFTNFERKAFFANYLAKKYPALLWIFYISAFSTKTILFAKTGGILEYEFHIWLQAFSARRHNKIRLKYSHYARWALGCRT